MLNHDEQHDGERERERKKLEVKRAMEAFRVGGWGCRCVGDRMPVELIDVAFIAP